MRLHYSREYINILTVNYDTPITTHKGKVFDASKKVLLMLLTKIPNKVQQLQNIQGCNNTGRYSHSRWNQGPERKIDLEEED